MYVTNFGNLLYTGLYRVNNPHKGPVIGNQFKDYFIAKGEEQNSKHKSLRDQAKFFLFENSDACDSKRALNLFFRPQFRDFIHPYKKELIKVSQIIMSWVYSAMTHADVSDLDVTNI